MLIAQICAGAGESGKSTVLKQMRLIYAQGFSKSEKEEWRAIIFNNILSAFKVILDAMEELGIEFSNKDNAVSDMLQFEGGLPAHQFGCCHIPYISIHLTQESNRCHFFANLCCIQQYINLILVDHDLGPKESMPTQYLPCFKALWVDAGVQKAIEKGNEFALHDNLN